MSDKKTSQDLVDEMAQLHNKGGEVREKLAGVTQRLKAKTAELGVRVEPSDPAAAKEPSDPTGTPPATT